MNLTELHMFVLEQAPTALPARRARLYRALAPVIGDEVMARRLNAMADECDGLDRDCRQLVLDFQRRAEG